MKTSKSKTESQRLAGSVQTARLRVSTAENRWKEAKEHARVARRRRKEARQAARRAKKQARLAKREFAEAQLALAEAEAKLVRSARTTGRKATKKRKPAKARNTLRGKKVAQPARTLSSKPGQRKRPKPGVAKPGVASSTPGGEKSGRLTPAGVESQTPDSGAEEPVSPNPLASQTV